MGIEEGDEMSFPAQGREVTIQFTGTLEDGTVFQSSPSSAFPIGVGKVIKGLDEGVMKMSLGEKAKFTITHDYAYGTEGAFVGALIPGGATLFFEVELLKVGNKSL